MSDFDPTTTTSGIPAGPVSNAAADSPLGKTAAYQTQYAPELLFPIARQQKRNELQLTDEARALLSELRPRVTLVDEALVGALSFDDQVALHRLLRQLVTDAALKG